MAKQHTQNTQDCLTHSISFSITTDLYTALWEYYHVQVGRATWELIIVCAYSENPLTRKLIPAGLKSI